MTLFRYAKLLEAAFALCVAASPLSLSAQVSPAQQLIPRAAVDVAELLLPNAPAPQVTDQAAPSPVSGQTAPVASSSSSQQAAPAGASASSQDSGTAEDPKKKQHEEAERELKEQEKQRLLGVMPQFQVVMNGQAVPMTGGEKWRLALHSAVDPFYIGWAFTVGGGYSELVDTNRGYGWGDAGYFKRVGANYADNVNGALIGNALLPQLLHQDPRYFRKGSGPFIKRFLYAAESTVVCRGDNGKLQPNVSNVLGNFISGGISNLYYPAEERGVALTLENGLSVTLFGALGGQLLEFGPDLNKWMHRKKQNAVPSPVGTAGDTTQGRVPDQPLYPATTTPAAGSPPVSH